MHRPYRCLQKAQQQGAFVREFSPGSTSVLNPIRHGATASALLTLPSPPVTRQALPITPARTRGHSNRFLYKKHRNCVSAESRGVPRADVHFTAGVAGLSKLLEDEGLVLQASRATFLTLARSPSSSGKKLEIYKGKRRGEKAQALWPAVLISM